MFRDGIEFFQTMFAEFAFDQKLAAWLKLPREGFKFFGGIPKKGSLITARQLLQKRVSTNLRLREAIQNFADTIIWLFPHASPELRIIMGKWNPAKSGPELPRI